MFELTRSDVGFGRLIVDDTGITRRRLIRTQRIEWDEVHSYRLGIMPTNSTGEAGRAFGGVIAAAIDFAAAVRGDRRPVRMSLELIGERRRLLVNWRFDNVVLAVEEALRRIGPRLRDEARRRFAADGVVRFGRLGVRAEAIGWKAKAPVAREAVEAIEISDGLPRRLRVLREGRALAHISVRLDQIPNVVTAIDLAEELGYRVRGRELLEAFRPTPAIASW
jgi:hypothetical protein